MWPEIEPGVLSHCLCRHCALRQGRKGWKVLLKRPRLANRPKLIAGGSMSVNLMDRPEVVVLFLGEQGMRVIVRLVDLQAEILRNVLHHLSRVFVGIVLDELNLQARVNKMLILLFNFIGKRLVRALNHRVIRRTLGLLVPLSNASSSLFINTCNT